MSDTRTLSLTQGLVAIVDEQDYPLLSQINWYAHKAPRTWYAWNETYGGMHRLITGATKEQLVDHRDGDGLNNTRDNLRKCSKPQNGMNRKKTPGLSSRFKGVTKRNGKWIAQVWHAKKHYRLGVFATEEAAARAYDEKAIELFGEFASLNFPQGGVSSAIS